MSKKATGAPAKLPLMMRLKAWWDGYDVDELAARYAAQQARLAEADQAARESVPEEDDESEDATAEAEAAAEELSAVDLVAPANPSEWNEEKINIAQIIWGEGYCGPGGPDYIVTLSKLMALSPEMSMLQLGCELGGPARVLVDRFGVWITGYDENQLLIDKGNDISEKMGMKKKAVLTSYDPGTFDGFDRKFDRALAKEAFFTIEDKAGMMDSIEDKLKPGGLLLLTDYVLGNEAAVAKEEFREWKINERSTPYLSTPDEMAALVKNARMQVRVSEDITDQYLAMINDAWSNADDVASKLAREEDGATKVEVLMKEAQFWTRRKKLLQSGDLRLWRIVGNKKASGPSMMSDW